MSDTEPEFEVYESRWERWRMPALVAAGLLVLIALLMLPSLLAREEINELEENVEELDADKRELEGRADVLEDAVTDANERLEQLGEPTVPVPEEGVEKNDPEQQDAEIQDQENQEAERQEPEVQQAEVNDPDPFDDEDPDDPEIQDAEVQDAEIQEPPIPGPAGPMCPPGFAPAQVRIPSVSKDDIFLVCMTT